MTPLPWSYSSLDCFTTCPRMYFHKYVAKDVEETVTPAQEYGTYVHKAFELRISEGRPLPEDLQAHEKFLSVLSARGTALAEQHVGLDRTALPCDFLSPSVWFRGVIDLQVFEQVRIGKLPAAHVTVVDYKTGRKRSKTNQLKLNALYCFSAGADVVDTRFYYTQDPADVSSRAVYSRNNIVQLWRDFTPSLRAYVEAFRTEDFFPKPCGLCKGWCPVKQCEFWRPPG